MKKEISRSKELSSLSCDIDSFIDFIVNLQETLFPEECNFSLTIYLKNNREEKIEFDSLIEFKENQKILPPRIQNLHLRLSSYTKNDNGVYQHKSINFTTSFSGSISASSEDEQWCDYAIHILAKFPIKHRVWYSSLKTDYLMFFIIGLSFVPAIWLSIFKTSLFSIFGSKNSNTMLFSFLLIFMIFISISFIISFILPRFTLRTKTQQEWTQKYREEIMIYGTLFGGLGGIVAIISLFIR
jgi:hypothetical protein